MHENINLVSDLALIFISAGIITIIFRWLKQPLILGYIVAGFLVGPHFGLFPNVTSVDLVKQWSEIGIIFLLFALGLEFSFKKLINVGSTALITAGTIFIGMFLCGLGVGKMLDWTNMESLFLGGMLSMSSTTIIIKAFNDLGLKNKPFTTVVFGTLVVEDLLAILLMVLLSTMAVSNQFAGKDMIFSFLKLAFFLILWFLVGIYIIPTLLKKAHQFMNDEMLLILSAGLCFGMVVLASLAGFSSALGAFIMGSILAETIEGERIEKNIKGIKDLFGAIFFVSVGMMVEPAIIIEYWQPIIILTVVVILGISFFATAGVLLSGKGVQIAVRSGFSMVQIGEFAFIIAGLGYSLGVMRGFIYPVIVAVSVITTFVTPYFIKMSAPFSVWLSNKLPHSFMNKINANSSSIASVSEQSDWKRLLKVYFGRIVLYSVLLLAIDIASSMYLYPFIDKVFTNISADWKKWISVGITIVVMSPFLYGLAVNKGGISNTFERLWYNKRSNRGPLISLILLRVFLAVTFLLSVFFAYFSLSYWVILAIAFGATSFFLIARRNIHRFEFMERRFLENFNQKEEMERERLPITTSVRTKLVGKDIKLENIIVSPNSKFVGIQLKNIPFRRDFGVNIVKIIRGNKVIVIPSAEEYIYPYDSILALGTDIQVSRFMQEMEADSMEKSDEGAGSITVESFILKDTSYIVGKSLVTIGMRQSGCMIIGVERGNESIMNPSPDFIFNIGDKVWMVGDKQACEWYM